MHCTRVPIRTQRFPPFCEVCVLTPDICPTCTHASIQFGLLRCVQMCLLKGLLLHAYTIMSSATVWHRQHKRQQMMTCCRHHLARSTMLWEGMSEGLAVPTIPTAPTKHRATGAVISSCTKQITVSLYSVRVCCTSQYRALMHDCMIDVHDA